MLQTQTFIMPPAGKLKRASLGSLNTMQPNIGRVHEQESEQEAESIKIDQDEHVNHEFLSEESKNQYEIEECKDPARYRFRAIPIEATFMTPTRRYGSKPRVSGKSFCITTLAGST